MHDESSRCAEILESIASEFGGCAEVVSNEGTFSFTYSLPIQHSLSSSSQYYEVARKHSWTLADEGLTKDEKMATWTLRLAARPLSERSQNGRLVAVVSADITSYMKYINSVFHNSDFSMEEQNRIFQSRKESLRYDLSVEVENLSGPWARIVRNAESRMTHITGT